VGRAAGRAAGGPPRSFLRAGRAFAAGGDADGAAAPPGSGHRDPEPVRRADPRGAGGDAGQPPRGGGAAQRDRAGQRADHTGPVAADRAHAGRDRSDRRRGAWRGGQRPGHLCAVAVAGGHPVSPFAGRGGGPVCPERPAGVSGASAPGSLSERGAGGGGSARHLAHGVRVGRAVGERRRWRSPRSSWQWATRSWRGGSINSPQRLALLRAPAEPGLSSHGVAGWI